MSDAYKDMYFAMLHRNSQERAQAKKDQEKPIIHRMIPLMTDDELKDLLKVANAEESRRNMVKCIRRMYM